MDTKDPRAVATKLFEKFFRAEEFDETLAAFDQITHVLGLNNSNLGGQGGWVNHFYPVLRVRKNRKMSSETNVPFSKISCTTRLSLYSDFWTNGERIPSTAMERPTQA